MSRTNLSAEEITRPIKRTTGETLEERLTDNAYYNILPARYLQKDGDGEVVETQEELFERVAKNIALAEAVFEAERLGVEVTVTPEQLKPDHPRRDELAEEVFGAGVTADADAETTLTEYNITKFAYDTIVPDLPDEIRAHVESVTEEFQGMMEGLDFMPNCVPPDSLVAAGGGMKQLSDIKPGERVYDDEVGNATVEEKFHNGEKLVVEITTESGYSVRATPEHYFRVIDAQGEYSWVQVKDIEPGQMLALQKNFLDDDGERPTLSSAMQLTDGGEVAASTPVGRPKSYIETPDTITPEFAEWLGLYVGDGTARESGVRVAFDETDEDLVEHWSQLTEDVFGFEPTTGSHGTAACTIGRASRRELYTFLEQNELLKESSATAEIPSAILQSGRTSVTRFLRGLFEADGTVGKRAIELYTHSVELASQVQLLLLGLGIRSKVREKAGGYRVTIRKNRCGARFVERVGFISDRKTERAHSFATVADNATSIKIPNQSERLLTWYRESSLGHDAYRALSQFLIDPESEYHQEIGKEIFERYAETYPELWDSPVAEHIKRDQFYESVSSITKIGTMSVEDMHVPRRNTYIVEGFVSHNSPTLMNAGDELQQLSACFVMSPDDDLTDIHETAKQAAEVFQCLTDETLVYAAEKGIVSIAEIEPGDEILQRSGDGYRVRPVTETHAYDDAPVRTLVTESGIELTGTPNHRLLIDDEWTEIGNASPGDEIAVRLGWLPDSDTAPTLESVPAGPQWHSTRTVENEAIATLHADGLNDYEIATELDCSPSTVQRRRADELALPPNGAGGRPAGSSFDDDTFADCYEQGYTDCEIAAELDVSPSSIRRYRAKHSLEPNGEPVKTVVQPQELTTELAELVGMWVGDGSKHENGIRFHLERDETLEHVDRLSRNLFGTGVDWTWAGGCYEAVIHSHEIKRWWLANFGDAKPTAPHASVPDCLWEAGHDQIGAFLRGLFSTDGSLQKDKYPRLWSASEQLINDVQQLLLGIGIPATRWELDSEDRDYYHLSPVGKQGLEAFSTLVGFVDERNEQLRETLETTSCRAPSCGRIVDGVEWRQEIVSVEDAGSDTVYDVTVAGDHEYVASSIVSHNSGGGVGYAFWQLRPYGDAVGSTGGIASGPITFMRTYDQLCETIAQGGTRRGAQMGVMRITHPDVIQFIHAKNKDVSLAHTLRLNDPDDFTHNSFMEALEEARDLLDEDGRVPEHLRNAVEGHLSNFNISVGITDGFMEALENGEEFTFINPRTEEPHIATPETKELYETFDLGEYVEVGEVLSMPAEILWERIIQGAHENGEPGVIYLERVNKEHSFDVEEHPDHRILATNPCLSGDMEVRLADGRTRPIRELAEMDTAFDVVTRDGDEIVTRPATAFKTKSDTEVVEVTTESGVALTATPDHEIRTQDDGWVEASDLIEGDQLIAASKPVATPHGSEIESVTETVVSVEPAGNEDVYDLTVDGTHNFYASADGTETINVHNCGEQPLEEYEACNLGHINLSTVADLDAPDWRVWNEEHADEFDSIEEAIGAFLAEAIDFDELDHRIEYGTRFLENVVTMSDFPVPEIETTVREMRKIGLGIMGLAQLYVQLGVRYGSEPANEVARQVMMHINHGSKRTSHELAGERGSFAQWDESKYADPVRYREWFEHQTGESADDWADGFPIRNHNTTTIAPTGTTGMLGNTTGGCEPIFNVAYYKNVSDDVQGDEMLVEFDDYFLRVLEANKIDVEVVKTEAQEQMANNEFTGVESLSTVPDAISELFVTTGNERAKEHAAVQCSCQAGVDSAISKTVNAPNDSTADDAREVFEYIYKHGGKGVTYYRDGTRSKQVLTTRAQNAEFAEMDDDEAAEMIVEQIEAAFGGLSAFFSREEVQSAVGSVFDESAADAVAENLTVRPRPDVLYGVTQRIDTGYGKLYVNINEDDEGRPFELFATIGNSGGFTNSFTEALAKTISTALRAGVDPDELANELQGIRSPKVAWDKGEQINSIPDAIGTAMRRYLDGEVEKAHPQQQHLDEIEKDDRETDGGALADDGAANEEDKADAESGDAPSRDDTQSLIDAGENPECPECGSLSLYFSEGCKTCESCGWSEC